jgi:hypothetical protein
MSSFFHSLFSRAGKVHAAALITQYLKQHRLLPSGLPHYFPQMFDQIAPNLAELISAECKAQALDGQQACNVAQLEAELGDALDLFREGVKSCREFNLFSHKKYFLFLFVLLFLVVLNSRSSLLTIEARSLRRAWRCTTSSKSSSTAARSTRHCSASQRSVESWWMSWPISRS